MHELLWTLVSAVVLGVGFGVGVTVGERRGHARARRRQTLDRLPVPTFGGREPSANFAMDGDAGRARRSGVDELQIEDLAQFGEATDVRGAS